MVLIYLLIYVLFIFCFWIAIAWDAKTENWVGCRDSCDVDTFTMSMFLAVLWPFVAMVLFFPMLYRNINPYMDKLIKEKKRQEQLDQEFMDRIGEIGKSL